MVKGPAIGSMESELGGIARGGGLNFAGSLVSQSAMFGVSLILARALGGTAVGLYAQAFAFLALLGLLSMSGFRAGLTRFIAVHRAEGDEAALRGTVRLGLGISLASACVLGGLLHALAPWLAVRAFDDPAMILPLRYVALALVPHVFTHAALSATQGFRTMRPYAVIGLVGEPATRIVLTAAAILAGLGVEGAMGALLMSHTVAAVLAGRSLRGLLGRPVVRPAYRIRELFGFSLVSWVASLASTGLIWADIIVLGLFLPASEVGVYQIASRLVMLVGLAMAPINTSLAPRIADLHRRGETETLRRSYAAASSWMLRLSLPGFVALLVFPRDLLSLFGEPFVAGTAVTLILVVGKLTDVATGPSGLMLNMTGRNVLQMIDNTAVLIANVGLNLWLIPRVGIEGAALAWAVSLIAVNVARVIQVHIVMRMLPFDRSTVKGLVGGAAALGTALAVRGTLEGPAGLPAGLLVLGATYLAVLFALRFSETDRMVARLVVARTRRAEVAP